MEQGREQGGPDKDKRAARGTPPWLWIRVIKAPENKRYTMKYGIFTELSLEGPYKALKEPYKALKGLIRPLTAL